MTPIDRARLERMLELGKVRWPAGDVAALRDLIAWADGMKMAAEEMLDGATVTPACGCAVCDLATLSARWPANEGQ